MVVTSSVFADNGIIPVKYTGFGEDVSPEFSIADIPESTETLTIILDDLDVPFTKQYTHWIAWNIPKVNVIPAGLPKGEKITFPISACQGIAWGKNGYRGPKPPFFIRNEHRYVFTVYALDCCLSIATESNKKDLLDAMKSHVLAEAQITGRYKRP